MSLEQCTLPYGIFRAYQEAQKVPRCMVHLGDRPIGKATWQVNEESVNYGSCQF